MLNDVIVWQRNLCREEICFIFHRIAGHVKEVEFLKDCGLLSVKLIMADLVQQDNLAHDFMQIRFDEDKAVTFDNLMRLNRRVPNGTHDGVRGRGLFSPSYLIV